MSDNIVKWQEIEKNNYNLTHRLEVIGGWLVKHTEYSDIEGRTGMCMVFVADPEHEWLSALKVLYGDKK